MMLVDTDVLIWHLRGYPQATRRLDELGALTLSAISWLEVLQGMRNKAELLAVKKMLAIGNGILTVENEAQAIVRADPAQGDKGGDAARAAITLHHLRNRAGIG